jgi:hypothetical protein
MRKWQPNRQLTSTRLGRALRHAVSMQQQRLATEPTAANEMKPYKRKHCTKEVEDDHKAKAAIHCEERSWEFDLIFR